ncbi:hypothetical protein DL764_001534 [Monosporascus ibericus]|uniref:Rhodopsin domain-containing protein n=1 Tax=Monosporascus ibericus TaxID=155417 RepID=A0A4Q4TQS9_9PEZI|nr:hypothetical protein DL764_001534 [Monosporascus ibericus]
MGRWEAEDYGVLADRACWAMFGFTTVVVGLRIYCRTLNGRNKQHGGLGPDDYITIGCWVVFLATCILVNIGSHYGLGKHYADVPEEHLESALKYNVIISAVLIWTFSLPKFVIIATLKRILNYGTKTTILFWSLALSSQACILATSVWWFVQCQPVEYGWNKVMIEGECADVSILADLGYFTSAYSAFLDIFFALYPIPFIMRLNMPLKGRIAMSSALSLSVLACVVSIYKLAIFGEVFAILRQDPTYPVPYLDILGMGEGFVLVTAASLPTLGPVFRAAKGKLTSVRSSRSASRSQLDAGSKDHSRAMGSNNWDNFKGHRLEDPASSIGTRPSLDDIPLVATSRAGGDQNERKDIQKTVEESISPETLEHGRQPRRDHNLA